MIDTQYKPKDIEKKWYAFWEEKAFFKADNTSSKDPFVIMMPPPNVTGALHQGHALTSYIQDCLIRWKRMCGYNVLWLPGSDHAGIATQNVVEKELAKAGTSRHKLGREKFLERVWQWKEQYGNRIMEQLRSFGSSCDWSRQRFTMDEKASKAVREVFVRLYQEKLIYRGDYLINWCPRCESAISDLEVTHVEKSGHLWQIKYPLEEGSGWITVATTRPETMLGDTAIAVHPKDDRYKSFVGKYVLLPLIKRKIPIIQDEYVDQAFGSGAVKITPGHDFNDFEVGRRHHLKVISVLDAKGKMNENSGAYQGLDRFKARKQVLEDLKTEGLLEGEESHTLSIGHCERCQTVVEPRHSTQWFVKTKPLAAPAIEAVRSGEVKIIPESWAKTYFHWMENIKDWCISRQIWWGHRIPAWHCRDCKKITVSSKDPVQCEHCKSKKIDQDPDVLDTWFSSALWPFSTLGWPDETKDLEKFYPSTVMETGFDILFFWVARMMMMGIHFMKKPPFQFVYLHAMVRDVQGQKMSKSKGNVIDPLDTIEKYGSDALRFTHLSLATQGRDVKLTDERIQGYRNFVNKIWNATRFVLMQESHPEPQAKDPERATTDRWILTRLHETIRDVNAALEAYKLNEATYLAYHFTWSEFCDWYIELSKTSPNPDVLTYVLKELLKLLHPFLPFVTEELWQHVQETESIMLSPYPKFDEAYIDASAKQEIEVLKAVVLYVRNIRGENNVKPSKQIPVSILPKDKTTRQILEREQKAIENLAKISELKILDDLPDAKDQVTGTVGFAEIFISMSELFNQEEEKKRLEKELLKIGQDLTGIQQRLSQDAFVSKAPKEVVEKERARLAMLTEKEAKLKENLSKIKTF
ncbi:MAG: valine--tRNA ligase [Deltaproteobacteria bacterium RIFCSPHIGHO2_02_FULL_40_11]|nr:MAG: valine--tRNA ligase [Deltaproteobacteria bacterium RIFCSPHIGHO2_02_FULL_40_11]